VLDDDAGAGRETVRRGSRCGGEASKAVRARGAIARRWAKPRRRLHLLGLLIAGFVLSTGAGAEQASARRENFLVKPAWLAHGTRIVFARQAGQTPESFQIYVMNRDGGDVRQLTDAAGRLANPR